MTNTPPISNLNALLRALQPTLHPGVQVFASVPHRFDLSSVSTLSAFREDEGWTLICSEEEARRAGLQILFRSAWITLSVNSDLNAVGFTAAIAAQLAEAGISCNVVAAARHDHLFVPVDLAQDAMRQLEALQKSAQNS